MDNYLSQRVLIVEDDGTSRKLLRGILKKIGFTQIDEAASGEDALTKMKSQTISMVLADWHMPGISGLELLKIIKKDQNLNQTKFLMVTVESRETNILEAVRAGVDGYIMKPYSKPSIQQKIDAIFSNHHINCQTSEFSAHALSNPTEHPTAITTS